MRRKIKDIASEALELPVAARAQLAKKLLDSLDDISEEENEKLWAEEGERRYDEYKAGKIKAVPTEEVFAAFKSRKK